MTGSITRSARCRSRGWDRLRWSRCQGLDARGPGYVRVDIAVQRRHVAGVVRSEPHRALPPSVGLCGQRPIRIKVRHQSCPNLPQLDRRMGSGMLREGVFCCWPQITGCGVRNLGERAESFTHVGRADDTLRIRCRQREAFRVTRRTGHRGDAGGGPHLRQPAGGNRHPQTGDHKLPNPRKPNDRTIFRSERSTIWRSPSHVNRVIAAPTNPPPADHSRMRSPGEQRVHHQHRQLRHNLTPTRHHPVVLAHHPHPLSEPNPTPTKPTPIVQAFGRIRIRYYRGM